MDIFFSAFGFIIFSNLSNFLLTIKRNANCFELVTDDRGCTPKDKYAF
jgi:hypothetical protein